MGNAEAFMETFDIEPVEAFACVVRHLSLTDIAILDDDIRVITTALTEGRKGTTEALRSDLATLGNVFGRMDLDRAVDRWWLGFPGVGTDAIDITEAEADAVRRALEDDRE